MKVLKVKDHPNKQHLVVVTWGNNMHSVAERRDKIQVGDTVIEYKKEHIDIFGVISEAKILEVVKNESINAGVRESEGESGELESESSDEEQDRKSEDVSGGVVERGVGDGSGEEVDWDPDKY